MKPVALISRLSSKHEGIVPRVGAGRGVLVTLGWPAGGVWFAAGVLCAAWFAALVVVVLRLGMAS